MTRRAGTKGLRGCWDARSRIVAALARLDDLATQASEDPVRRRIDDARCVGVLGWQRCGHRWQLGRAASCGGGLTTYALRAFSACESVRRRLWRAGTMDWACALTKPVQTRWRKKCPRAERCTRPPTGAAIRTVESMWRDAFARSAVSEDFQEGTALVGLAATNPTCCFHRSPDAEGHAVPVRRVIP